VFYELITGQKPFQAESAMDMFMKHVNIVPERPSRTALDLPVWLDTLIMQLLEKKLEHRPFDAHTVHNALASIQEKVEAQLSAGVDAARARLMDRPRGERNPSEEDKDAARLILTGKSRTRRKLKKIPLYQRTWAKAVGLVVLLLGVMGLLLLVFRPASPEKLYGQIERLMSTKKPEDQDKARALMGDFLRRHGKKDIPQTEQVRKWVEDLDVAEKELLVERHLKWVRRGRQGLQVQPKKPVEKTVFRAAEAEEAGDVEQARNLWQDVRKDEEAGIWSVLAQRHLKVLDGLAVEQKRLEAVFRSIRNSGKEPTLGGIEQEVFTAVRSELFGDLLMARQRFDRLKERLIPEPEQRFWLLFAAWRSRDLSARLKDDPPMEERKEFVKRKVSTAVSLFNTKPPGFSYLDVQADCLNLIALYGADKEFASEVKSARGLLKRIAAELGITRPG
jgi:hypothetical protein